MRPSSRTEYQSRINRVIRHLDENLSDDVALEALAKVARLSPFHFHRVFRAMTGESLNAFVQRRRLERAARELALDPSATILEVAMRHGYESAAAFSRAFRRAFGTTAMAWRRSGAEERRRRLEADKERHRHEDSKIGKEIALEVWQKLTRREPPVIAPRPAVEPMVESLPRRHALALQYVGPYGSGAIPATWDRLMRRADARGLVDAQTECVGIVHDDPAVTDRQRCRYDACVVVQAAIDDEELSSTVVGGGEYLTFSFVGTPHDIDQAWDSVYAYLPESGCLPKSGPNLEWYPPQAIVDPVKMTFRCKLCLPIERMKPRAQRGSKKRGRKN